MATHTAYRAYARTRDGQIHYQVMGEGPPLLLLSESPRTHRQFRQLAPLLAPHFQTIAVDTPGYGNSDPPAQPVRIEGVAATLADFVQQLDIGRVHVFGVHTGNKLAAVLAADWPQLVDRVVLAGYPHSIIPENAARNAAIRPIFERFHPQYGADAHGSHRVRAWAAAQATLNTLWWPQKLLVGADVGDADIADAEAHAIDYVQGWRNTVAMYEAVFALDLAAAYSRIAAPTLVLEFRVPQERHLGEPAARVAATMRAARAAAVETGYPLALQDSAAAIAHACLPFLLGGHAA